MLIPAIKAVAGTPIGDEAKTLASQAGGFAGNKDYGQANYLLDRVQELVKTNLLPRPPTSTAKILPKPAWREPNRNLSSLHPDWSSTAAR